MRKIIPVGLVLCSFLFLNGCLKNVQTKQAESDPCALQPAVCKIAKGEPLKMALEKENANWVDTKKYNPRVLLWQLLNVLRTRTIATLKCIDEGRKYCEDDSYASERDKEAVKLCKQARRQPWLTEEYADILKILEKEIVVDEISWSEVVQMLGDSARVEMGEDAYNRWKDNGSDVRAPFSWLFSHVDIDFVLMGAGGGRVPYWIFERNLTEDPTMALFPNIGHDNGYFSFEDIYITVSCENIQSFIDSLDRVRGVKHKTKNICRFRSDEFLIHRFGDYGLTVESCAYWPHTKHEMPNVYSPRSNYPSASDGFVVSPTGDISYRLDNR